MSTNDYILNLLNIKDKNIKILDGKQEIKSNLFVLIFTQNI